MARIQPKGGLLISSGGDGTVHLWSLSDRLLRRVIFTHGGAVRELAIDPRGQFIATTADDRRLFLWEQYRGRGGSADHPFSYANPLVTALAFSPDGQWILLGGISSEISVLDAESGRAIGGVSRLSLPPNESIWHAGLIPAGCFLGAVEAQL